jgi:hypothetical protein
MSRATEGFSASTAVLVENMNFQCKTWPGDDQMNEYDSEVAHPGNGIDTQTTTLSPIWQFAIDPSGLSDCHPYINNLSQ